MPANKLDAADLQGILPRLELSDEAAALIASCHTAAEVLDRLIRSERLLEAARLCAYALPPRERVWWAARCAGATATAALPETDREACTLAEDWVRSRSDAARRAAMDKALSAGCTSPEAWVAVAAFWSGDSMAPPNQPKVPPAPHLSAIAVAGAVILASVRTCPERQADRLRRFVDSAKDIATGGAGHLQREAG
jgi:hypothetical protein